MLNNYLPEFNLSAVYGPHGSRGLQPKQTENPDAVDARVVTGINVVTHEQGSTPLRYANSKYRTFNRDNVPLYITINDHGADAWNNESWQHVSMGNLEQHTHTFSHLSNRATAFMRCNLDIQGSLCAVAVIPLFDIDADAVYIDITRNETSKSSLAFLYAVSCNYNGIKRCCNGQVLHINQLYGTQTADYQEMINHPSLYEANLAILSDVSYFSALDRPHFAADHSYHVNSTQAVEFVTNINSSEKRRLSVLKPRVMAHLGYAAVMGIILWTVSAPAEAVVLAASRGFYDSTTVADFIAKGKAISEDCKFMQNIIKMDVTALFEIHTLINRVETPIDWSVEKYNRTHVNVVQCDQQQLYNDISAAFKFRLATSRNRYQTQDWEEFWNKRMEWCSAGAAYSHVADDAEYLDARAMYRNKMIMVNSMPKLAYKHFATRPAECHAKTSIKYEWSKQRAIYGCDVTNFIMFQFAMGNCEAYLDSSFPIGKHASPDKVNRIMQSTLLHAVPLCLDFSDFNSQHSTDSMRTVLRAFNDCYHNFMSPEQQHAMAWCLESLNNQYVHDSVGGTGTYLTSGTLFSGWRLTSFMNTLLNYGYYEQLITSNNRARHLHSGDDILVGSRRLQDYNTIMQNAKRINVRFSKGKCHFGSIAEFLRVDHYGAGSGQYLSRGIATMIMSRIESDPAYDYKDYVKATLTRAAAVITRGGSYAPVTTLTKIIIRDMSITMTGGRLDPIMAITTDNVNGGISDLSTSLRTSEIIKLELHQLQDKGFIRDEDLPTHHLHGIDDFVTWVTKKYYGIYKLSRDLKRKLRDTIISTYLRKPARYITTAALPDHDVNRAGILRAIKGAHTDTITHVEYGRAKALGIVLDVLRSCVFSNVLLEVVMASKDPVRTLSKIV